SPPAQPAGRAALAIRAGTLLIDGAPEVVQQRLALEVDLASAVAVVALRVAFAVPRAAGVGYFDVGQVLLQIGPLLVHRHAVILPAVANLDPSDHARGIHPAGAERLAQVAIREAVAEAAVLESPQQVGSPLRSDPRSEEISHDVTPIRCSLAGEL